MRTGVRAVRELENLVLELDLGVRSMGGVDDSACGGAVWGGAGAEWIEEEVILCPAQSILKVAGKSILWGSKASRCKVLLRG